MYGLPGRRTLHGYLLQGRNAAKHTGFADYRDTLFLRGYREKCDIIDG
jgi:hypothetical protein